MRREAEKDWGQWGVSRGSDWHSEAASRPRAMRHLGGPPALSRVLRHRPEVLQHSWRSAWFLFSSSWLISISRTTNDHSHWVYWSSFVGASVVTLVYMLELLINSVLYTVITTWLSFKSERIKQGCTTVFLSDMIICNYLPLCFRFNEDEWGPSVLHSCYSLLKLKMCTLSSSLCGFYLGGAAFWWHHQDNSMLPFLFFSSYYFHPDTPECS